MVAEIDCLPEDTSAMAVFNKTLPVVQFFAAVVGGEWTCSTCWWSVTTVVVLLLSSVGGLVPVSLDGLQSAVWCFLWHSWHLLVERHWRAWCIPRQLKHRRSRWTIVSCLSTSGTFMHSAEKCVPLQNAQVLGRVAACGLVALDLGFVVWVRKVWAVVGVLYSACDSIGCGPSPASMTSISLLMPWRSSVSVHSLLPWSLAMSWWRFLGSFSWMIGTSRSP